MTTRVEKILEKVRYTVADTKKERWTDDRLLVLVNEAQIDIAKHTHVLKGETNIVPTQNTTMYNLPDDCWLITRASYNGQKIALWTYDDLDSMTAAQIYSHLNNNNNIDTYETSNTSDFDSPGTSWETEKGNTVAALVYDRRNMAEIRFYPIPSEAATQDIITDYGVLVDIDDADYVFSSDYGVVTGITDPDVDYIVMDTYGVVIGSAEANGVVHIWYVKMPTTTVSSVSDSLEIPDMYDVAIKHYVVSQAYGDDYDTANAQKMQDAYLLYERELGLIDKTTSLDNRQGGSRQGLYRTAFNQ